MLPIQSAAGYPKMLDPSLLNPPSSYIETMPFAPMSNFHSDQVLPPSSPAGVASRRHFCGSSPRLSALQLLAASLVVVAMFAGCSPPPRPVLGKNQAETPAETLLDPRVETEGESVEENKPFAEPWETWQAYYIGGRHVGYSHVKVALQSDTPDSLVGVTIEDQLAIRRGPSTVIQRLDQTSLETRDGKLVSFEAELRVGPALTRYSGNVEGNSLTVVTTRGTKRSSQSVPWESSYHGPAGLQQSLLSTPIDQDQERRLQALLPIRFDVATLELDCKHLASIAMPDGTIRQAREVEVAMKLENSPPINTVLWTDDKGNVIKTLTPALDLVAFNSTREAATQGIVASEDILSATAVEIEGTLEKPQETKTATFRFTARSGVKDPGDIPAFAAHPGQWVKKNESGDYEIVVSRDAAAAPPTGFQSPSLTPSNQDSRSGPLVDSAHSLVKQLADTAIAKKNEQAQLALELTRSTHSLIRKKNYTSGFIPASEVARAGEGDCTAHAVLLSAMLRARGIPSRVAIGLVYVPAEPKPRLAYHMWTIAYINDQWLHFDATLPGGFAPADRITLTTNSLDSGNEYESLAPVLGTIGQYNIEVTQSETGALEP